MALSGSLLWGACQVPNPAYDSHVRQAEEDATDAVSSALDGAAVGAHQDGASMKLDAGPTPDAGSVAADASVVRQDAKSLPLDAALLPIDAPASLAEAAAAPSPDAPPPAPDASELLLPPLAANLRTGLVGYWPLDRTIGTGTPDHSGHGNHAEIEASDKQGVWAEGKFDRAARFGGGAGPALRVAASASVNSVIGAVTVAAWILPTDANAEPLSTVISRQEGDQTHDQYDLTVSEGRLQFYMFEPGDFDRHRGVSADLSTPPGAWIHVAATCSGGNMRLYIDGVLRGSATFPVQLRATTKPVFIGTNVNEGDDGRRETMHGLMDEVLLYNRALTDVEIKELASRTAPLWR